jgi:hypothetical protein
MARSTVIVLEISIKQERSRREVWVCPRYFQGKRANRFSPHQSKGEAHVLYNPISRSRRYASISK